MVIPLSMVLSWSDHGVISDEQNIAVRGPIYNGNGMRNVDQSNWSFNANGFIWSEGEKYDAKDWRIVFDGDKDILSRVDLKSGTVGMLDSNVECLSGISYEAGEMETYLKYNQSLVNPRRDARYMFSKSGEDAEARLTMNALTNSMPLTLLERENILLLPENLSECGKFEQRPSYDICRHVFQYARDHPQGDEAYKTPNLIRTFDRIVNNEAFARCGANVEVQGSRQDFCCKHVRLLAAINNESVLYLSIESTLQTQTKQFNDAIVTVRGGICHKHLHNRDTTCPVCRTVAHARSESYKFKASLQDPCKSSEKAKTERVKADRQKRDLSNLRPANNLFVKCDFSLTIGNYFAFAIVALITAPKDLLSFTIDTPCNKCEEASHSSDACGTCLRGFAYNLRKARVTISSIPFSTVMTCVAVHEHQASVKDDKLTNRTV